MDRCAIEARPALGFQTVWAAVEIDDYPDLVMQKLLRAGLFCLIVLAASPVSGAECPEGTRNNYKGECVVVAPEDEQIQQVTKETEKFSPSPIVL